MSEMKFLVQHYNDRILLNDETTVLNNSKLPIVLFYSDYAGLTRFNTDSRMVPLGSIEFTRKFAHINNLVIPVVECYPAVLNKYFYRNIYKAPFAEARHDQFIKPILCKQFKAGLRSTFQEPLPDLLTYFNAPIWISDPVNFTAEYRVYIHDSSIVGWNQYGEGDDRPLDLTIVQNMVEDYIDAPIGYSLDVGYTDNDELALVEINDGWSLGLYNYNKDPHLPDEYIKLIYERWQEIVNDQIHLNPVKVKFISP